MRKLVCSIISLLVSLSCGSASFAQASQAANSQAPTLTVTVFASSERVRFTAPASVVQMRLEVYDAAGRKLFDNELRGGNVLDWLLQDGQAARLPNDTYLCVVTVKGRSGRITQKLGSVLVEQERASVQAMTAEQLTAQQAAAIGPVEAQASLSVVKADETQTTTVIAHNGEEGQLVRGRGALSFRLGDFYSGKNSEQMRLTADGKLGLGVTDPQAKLDVVGTIRTSEGIVFPDGSIQTTAYVASGRSLSERVGLQRDVQGRSSTETGKPGGAQQYARLAPDATPGRLAKFAADGVTPVDTQLSESNGTLVVGNAGATGNLQIFGPATADVFAGMGPDVVNGPALNYGYAGSSFGRSAGFFNVRPDASAVAPNPSLRFLTANQQRMIITNTGNVGIGTLSPTSKLEIAAQDGLAITGFNPFLTLRDTGNSNRRSFIQGVNGDLAFIPDSFSGGSAALVVKNNSGNVGIGINDPGAKLQVIAGSSTAIHATSQGNAVIGLSTAPNFAAVYGENNSGVTGYGIYGKSSGNNAVGVYGESGASHLGQGVRGESTAVTGYGVYARNTAGMALAVDGNATQNRDKGGLVKAMVYVDANGNIVRCYNSQRQDGGAGLPPSGTTGCGFNVSHTYPGYYQIDFGFKVIDRFLSATPQQANETNICAQFYFFNSDPNEVQIVTNITDVDWLDSNTDNGFMLIIY